jgi:hypothetical protein
MIRRWPLALLALTLALGCSKKKSAPQFDPEEQKQKLAPFILDQVPEIQNKVAIKFGDNLSLLGYSLDHDPPLKPGSKVKMTFYWQTTAKIEGGYKLFTQIMDASGEKLLFIDRNAPLRPNRKQKNGGLPVGAWEPGKVYVDEQTFHVPKAKTDTIRVMAGLSSKGGRMVVSAGDKDNEDRAIVANIAIQPSEKQKLARLPSEVLTKLEAKDKITIDGKLSEEAWSSAPVLGPLVDVANGSDPKDSPVKGSARLLWNDTNLYLGVEVEDANILGGFPKDAKDPHLWTKDCVELMVDPDGDGDNVDYYEIQIGPQNLVFDSQFDAYNEPKTEPDGPFGHQDWSSKLKSAVVVDGTIDKPEDTDKGYTVEAAIPWKSFGKAKQSPPALGDTWRLNVYAMKENSGVAWSPILGQGNFHKASRFGRIQFIAKGWKPPEAVDGGAPAPGDSATAAASGTPPAASSGAMQPASPKAMAAELKAPVRPLPSAH